jgi:histidine triad (HIT) family protein
MAMTEEELSKMSPEEMRELQKQQCIFCQIISGKVQSRKVYEDDKAVAILDINPGNPGHLLLLPKEHYSIMPQVPDADAEYIFTVAKHLSQALIKALGAKGTNIFLANGAVAGQRAPHVMIHIIPRMPDDGLKAFNMPSKEASPEELAEIQPRISEKIYLAMGKKFSKPINLDRAPEKISAEAHSSSHDSTTQANAERKTEHKTEQKAAQVNQNPQPKPEIDLDKVSQSLFSQLGGN